MSDQRGSTGGTTRGESSEPHLCSSVGIETLTVKYLLWRLCAAAGTAVFRLSVEETSDGPVCVKKELWGAHSGTVHSVKYCRLQGETKMLASVGDDGCFIWNLVEDEEPRNVRSHFMF